MNKDVHTGLSPGAGDLPFCLCTLAASPRVKLSLSLSRLSLGVPLSLSLSLTGSRLMSLGGKDVMRLVGELHVERQTASASSRRMVCSCVFEMAAMCMALLTAGCFRRAASLPFLAPRGWDAGAQAGSRRASRCTYTKKKKLAHGHTPFYTGLRPVLGTFDPRRLRRVGPATPDASSSTCSEHRAAPST